MKTNRLEAFSDGVIAVIITIMVLELKPPHESTVAAILAVLPSFVIYGLSFLVVSIMWINHHHLMHSAKRADVGLLWANNNLLFWMSLIPFVTGYLGQHFRDSIAVAAYGAIMTMAGLGFLILEWVLATQHAHSELQILPFCKRRLKATIASLLYASTVGFAFLHIEISYGIFLLIPAAYFWPDKRLYELN
jgi:uncharacterized membrane protein